MGSFIETNRGTDLKMNAFHANVINEIYGQVLEAFSIHLHSNFTSHSEFYDLQA